MSYSSWQRDVRQTQRRFSEKYLGRSGVIGEQITAYRGDTGVVQLIGNNKTVNSWHPYFSVNSWRRIAPEQGTPVMVVQRADTQSTEIIGYQGLNYEKKLKDYGSSLNACRPLKEGEFDDCSKGFAGVFYSERGLLSMRGGLSRAWLSQDKLESGSKAAVHTRQGIYQRYSKIVDEERFGSIHRSIGADMQQDVTKRNWVKIPTYSIMGVALPLLNYGKEYLRVYGRSSDTNLVDFREGNVTDDDGIEILDTITERPLRSRRVYTTYDLQEAIFKIDDEGNVIVELPNKSPRGDRYGIRVDAPAGGLELNTGLDITLSTLQNILMNITKNLNISALSGFTIKTSSGNGKLQTGGNLTLTIGRVGNIQATQALNISGSEVSITTPTTLLGKKLKFENIPWYHGHMTIFGPTQGPIPV